MTITISGKTISMFLLVVVLLALCVNALWVHSELKSKISKHDVNVIKVNRGEQLANLSYSIDSLKSVVSRLDSISSAQKTSSTSSKPYNTYKEVSLR